MSGNLVLQMQDEQLAGRGLDLYALRTYNSLGALNDGDGDGWRWGYEQTVRFQGPGTPAQPQAGATVIRTDGDGHETTYTWNAARAAYIGTEGGGAHDELRYDGASGEWVWTDGSTRDHGAVLELHLLEHDGPADPSHRHERQQHRLDV